MSEVVGECSFVLCSFVVKLREPLKTVPSPWAVAHYWVLKPLAHRSKTSGLNPVVFLVFDFLTIPPEKCQTKNFEELTAKFPELGIPHTVSQILQCEI